ncbi:hypothetical protein [Hydrocarboniphaga effusa]|uniref:hypothetical protein n=1 Tax=Hydrocarboniphaga effusa TaxID=243629 RepID=UPI003BAAAB72
MAEPTSAELAAYTDDEIGALRLKLEREVARRAVEETRPVYRVSVTYPSGNMTDHYKSFERGRQEAIKELTQLKPDDRNGVLFEIVYWSLSEYNARPEIVYG